MESVLPQNGLRFAAKWNAFCRKMEGVLPQNELRFGPKWKAFWPKMGCVLAQNGKHLCTKRVAFVCVFTSMKHCLSLTIRQEREEAKLE